jgi:hypothetical protein
VRPEVSARTKLEPFCLRRETRLHPEENQEANLKSWILSGE